MDKSQYLASWIITKQITKLMFLDEVISPSPFLQTIPKCNAWLVSLIAVSSNLNVWNIINMVNRYHTCVEKWSGRLILVLLCLFISQSFTLNEWTDWDFFSSRWLKHQNKILSQYSFDILVCFKMASPILTSLNISLDGFILLTLI